MAVPPKHNAHSSIHYLLGADSPAEAASQAARALGISRVYWLSQRGSRLGWIGERQRPAMPTLQAARNAWKTAQPILLPGYVAGEIPAQQLHITAAHSLMEAVLDGADCEALLQQGPYAARLAARFELLASTYDEGDPQAIVKVEFDALNSGAVVAENIWVKIAWLSYAEQDASLRFRFSFGMENYEDVAADPERQRYAAALCEAIFPESAVISGHPGLTGYLRELLQVEDIEYVERIVYFNAPEGGAQFHHDVERCHLGVVFAQLTGRTAWLALSTGQLLDEILAFLALSTGETALRKSSRHAKTRAKLSALAQDRATLADALNKRDNDALERLINRTPAFARHLIENGHGYILTPGDILLLPQHDVTLCTWHAVYCLDDHPGEALSFAIRQAGA